MKGLYAALVLIVLVVVAGFLLAIAGLASSSPSASPSPSVSPSPTATPTPPASLTTVHAALAKRHRARRARTALIRVRRCFGDSVPVAVAAAPNLASTEAVWAAASARWSWQARDWRAKVKAGIAKMKKPGGSGAARWWPAALYCGWRASLKSWFCAIVWRESTARLYAEKPSSHCFGLLQEHPCWWGSKGYAWIRDAFNQLRLGWHIYRVQGPSAWAL